MSGQTGRFYRFDSFLIDTTRRALLRGGRPVALKPKAFETLLALVENRGRVVEKEELMRALWPDSFVEDGNLTQQVSLVRKALGDDPREPRFIITLPGRGYSFVAPVFSEDEPAAAPTTPTTPTPEQSAPELAPRKPAAEDPAPLPDAEALQPAAEVLQPAAEAPRPAAGAAPRPALDRGAARRRAAAAVVFAGVVAVVAWLGYLWNARRGGGWPAVRSIAVLPFKSEGEGGGEEDYLRLGLADALAARLGGLRRVAVVPTTEALKYDRPGQDALAAGRALGADAVLDGVLRKAGERLRVTARLLEVRTGRTLWAQTFDEPWAGIFDVQDAISARVGEELALSLDGPERERLARRPTDNPEAYALYMQAEYLSAKQTKEAVTRSAEYYRRAVELDPKFAMAYFGLAECYIWPQPGLSERESYERQKELLAKTLEADPAFAPAYSMLAAITWRTEWDWAGAERQYRAALELSPNDQPTLQRYGGFLVSQGRFDEGLAHLRRAVELAPTALSTSYLLGVSYIYARRYDQAVAQFREVLELEPDFVAAHSGLGLTYSYKGMHAEAVEALEKALRLDPPNRTGTQGYLGHVYARAGRRADALRVLEEVKRAGEQERRADWGALAVIHAGLGENDRAFECLEESLRGKEWWVSQMKVNPIFDSLRADPRFADLVRRTGLAP